MAPLTPGPEHFSVPPRRALRERAAVPGHPLLKALGACLGLSSPHELGPCTNSPSQLPTPEFLLQGKQSLLCSVLLTHFLTLLSDVVAFARLHGNGLLSLAVQESL